MIDLDELAAIADGAVDRVVPEVLAARRTRTLTMTTKSSLVDLVTEMDEWAERELVAHIRAARPDDGILGEEGASVVGSSGVTWVIDPIDGTTNYVYDIPGASVSVAASVEGRAVIGVVHDLFRGERFRGTAGGGATRDGEPLEASTKSDLATALVATGFSYDPEQRRRQAQVLVELLPQVRDIRRLGGAAIDLCSVAAGRFDGFYERGLNPWDHAAGGLIAVEAGAVITAPADGALIAAAPGVFEALVGALEAAGAHHA